MLNIPLENKYEVDFDDNDATSIEIPKLFVVLSIADALNLAAWIVKTACLLEQDEDEFHAVLGLIEDA